MSSGGGRGGGVGWGGGDGGGRASGSGVGQGTKSNWVGGGDVTAVRVDETRLQMQREKALGQKDNDE